MRKKKKKEVIDIKTIPIDWLEDIVNNPDEFKEESVNSAKKEIRERKIDFILKK